MYEIRFARDVEADLRRLRAYDRQRVLGAIERHLTSQPAVQARNRKLLRSLIPPWTAEGPIWELRVGEHRVFYDVADAERIVYVRAVRRQAPGRRTEDML